MPILCYSPLHFPPKIIKPISCHHLPTPKNIIFTSCIVSKRHIDAGFGVSRHRGMSELVGVGAFGGGGGADLDRVGEGEAILGSGSPEFARGLTWGELESTINRMSKWLVAALFGLVILWKHDAEALWAAMGSVVNVWLSTVLKQILNHERPVSAMRSDPGMPSSHAQSIFYAAMFAFLSLIQWLGLSVFTMTIGTLTLTFASYLSWLRVSQRLHTVSQVLVGAILGSSCAATWFWLWQSFVFRAFVSFIWVRIVVVLGSAAFCLAFLLYVIQHWLSDEQ